MTNKNQKIKNEKKESEQKENIKNSEIKDEHIQVERLNNTRYISYNRKLTINVFMFIVTLLVSTILVYKSIDFKNAKIINYKEDKNIDYKVLLKPNDFYEENYLGKDMVYVANLIDKINVDFNYKFNIEENNNIDFDYKIIGKLIISNSNGSNYLEKEYTLVNNKNVKMENNKEQLIKESIVIDYDYYNELANSFKSSYGIETNSYLEISLVVNKLGNNIKLNEESKSLINIPLSEKSIEIKFDTDNTILDKSLVVDKELNFKSNIFIISLVFIILSIVLLVNIIKLLKMLVRKKSIYDKYVNKILNEYDRLIVETSTLVNYRNKNVININKFEELLDVRDNLQLPIMYYNVTSHQKCYFYILQNNNIYLLKIKAIDME